jgi:acyl-CoA thioesterase
MNTFQDSILLAAAGENLWSGAADPDYRGFGSQFGGWTAAALLKAIMLEPSANGAPLSQSVLFIEAIHDGPFEISTRLIRSGARLQFWRSELQQGGKCCAHAQVTMGVRRETTSFTDAVMPDVPPAETPGLGEWTPPSGFGTKYRSRWITPLPRSPDLDRSKPASSLVWQEDRAGRPLDILALAAIVDLAPPRVMWKRDTVSASSTVSMTTHFHATPEEIAAVGSRPILSEVHCRRCEGGYFDHELKLWSPDGALLATSEQVAAFRD